jgi:hypothetical protein
LNGTGERSAIVQTPPLLEIPLEIVMDSHRVIGNIRTGAPRRLIDILNALTDEFFIIHNAYVDDPFDDADVPPRRFDILQVRRKAVLFAIPRNGFDPVDAEFEKVAKDYVPSTIVLPGFEVRGDLHVLHGSDPAHVPLPTHRHFIAVSEAVVRCSHGRPMTWREKVIFVNVERNLLFGVDTPQH